MLQSCLRLRLGLGGTEAIGNVVTVLVVRLGVVAWLGLRGAGMIMCDTAGAGGHSAGTVGFKFKLTTST